MENFNLRKYLAENKLLKEELDSFKSEDGSGIHITGFGPGDLYLTLDPNEHQEMLDTAVTTGGGEIDANGVTIYYSVGTE